MAEWKSVQRPVGTPFRKQYESCCRVREYFDHENEEQFLKLFESFRAYAEPENIVDYQLVFNATVCTWEIGHDPTLLLLFGV